MSMWVFWMIGGGVCLFAAGLALCCVRVGATFDKHFPEDRQ